ncbi:MAG: hypothetical protein C5B57_06800, partial [Blastocatellia bacterium]
TMGVGHYTEGDVYAAARVFSGWNLTRLGADGDLGQHYEFFYDAGQHDTGAKTFSFPIYSDGTHTIAARAAGAGMQDGIDLINALAGNRNTAQYLAAKLYRFFVSEFRTPDPLFIGRIAATYLQSGYEMKPVIRELLLSSQFWDSSAYFARYGWPVEFVVRALKRSWVGWLFRQRCARASRCDGAGSVRTARRRGVGRGPLVVLDRRDARSNELRIVTGWKPEIQPRSQRQSCGRNTGIAPLVLLGHVANAPPRFVGAWRACDLSSRHGPWTGSDAQLQAKASGLVHLIAALPEYQFV